MNDPRQSYPYQAEAAAAPPPSSSPAPYAAAPATSPSATVMPIQYTQTVGAGGVPLPPQQLQQPQPQQIYPRQGVVLPVGAVPYNGGVLVSQDMFSNYYCVPGPGGEGVVWYDRRLPMPPVPPGGQPPTLTQQWHTLGRWIKLFCILLLVFWGMEMMAMPKAGILLPLLFLPTYLLYQQWRKHYESVELYMLARLYACAFAPGALVVMLIESVATVLFMLLCFRDYAHDYAKGVERGENPVDPATGTDSSNDNNDNNEGLEFLNYPESPQLFLFLFLLAFVSAGIVEESLKYYLTNSIRKQRPAYRRLRGFLLYACAAALGFSTVENIGYVLGGAHSDYTFLGIALNALGRTCISTPLHVMTGYLIGLQVIRRDLLHEPLNLTQVMGWSVAFHGAFDFGLFVIMALQSHWSSADAEDEDNNLVSFVLMACVVVNVYAGLAFVIHHYRKKVFTREEEVEQQEEEQARLQQHQQPQAQQPHQPQQPPPIEQQGRVHSDRGANASGFTPLNYQQV